MMALAPDRQTPASGDPLDPLTAPFFAAAADGRLVVQRCISCGRHRWTPTPMCPSCNSLDAAWSELSPRGTVWSFCVVHPPVLPSFAHRVPFAVLVVALDEQPHIRMIGDLVDAGHPTVTIGDRVEAVFDVVDNTAWVRWRRA